MAGMDTPIKTYPTSTASNHSLMNILIAYPRAIVKETNLILLLIPSFLSNVMLGMEKITEKSKMTELVILICDVSTP